MDFSAIEDARHSDEAKQPQPLTSLHTNGTLDRSATRGSPDRRWSSLKPNMFFMDACVSVSFGSVRSRFESGLDEEVIEARATLEAWRRKPLCNPCRFTAPAEVVARPASVSLDLALAAKRGMMSSSGINAAYTAYLADPNNETGNLQTALFIFAGKEGRIRQCKDLLLGDMSYVQPEDILNDFALFLLDRLNAGLYKDHQGKLERWIGVVWKRSFFPDYKTKFYNHLNLTVGVDEREIKWEKGESPDHGVLYRYMTDYAQHTRDGLNPSASELLNDLLTSIWDQLSTPQKVMLRAMRNGDSKEEAAKAAGVGVRQGRRIWQQIVETANTTTGAKVSL